MNKFFKTIAATTAVATVGLGATAAHAADATATATAQILQQVTIVKTADLNFGSIVPNASQSANVLVAANAAGTRTCPATVTCAGNANVSSAQFTVTGSPGQTVNVTGLTGLTTLSDGTNSMPISLSGSTLDMTTGTDTLYVGGDLTVGANQASGTYTGNFTVTVNY